MTPFASELAEIRFGCGLSPRHAPPASRAAMLDGLTGPDTMAAAFPVEDFDAFRARMRQDKINRVARKEAEGTPQYEAADQVYDAYRKATRIAMAGWAGNHVQRRVQTDTGFRERLVDFWTDHFTAYGKGGILIRAAPTLVEDAIRPHVAGRFDDLLFAAVTHPVMLHYLDQDRSIGPNSPLRARAAARGREGLGLNENLAREVLELHTLGVDGPYGQDDVRQLAELFTGLNFNDRDGFIFRPRMAEPGPETVLGRVYGEDEDGLDAIRAALSDLAAHPATHRHLAGKLAVHFVADTPDPDLVDALAAAFATGELMAVYDALLAAPAAWSPDLRNAKPPFGFVTSALRALDAPPDLFTGLRESHFRRAIIDPMAAMGQLWLRPAGPDGFPEEDENWFTPQGLSTRIQWAMTAPEALRLPLPDPRAFPDMALGGFANETVRFAASAAESQSEAVGLVLSSPAFQRR
jgi:uncharacterized protein (DUF1800 family)